MRVESAKRIEIMAIFICDGGEWHLGRVSRERHSRFTGTPWFRTAGGQRVGSGVEERLGSAAMHSGQPTTRGRPRFEAKCSLYPGSTVWAGDRGQNPRGELKLAAA